MVGIPGTGSNHGNSHLTAGILNQKQRSVKLISDAPKRETGRQKHIESSSLIRTEETLVGAVRIESATPQSKSRKRNGSAPPPLLNWSLWGPKFTSISGPREMWQLTGKIICGAFKLAGPRGNQSSKYGGISSVGSFNKPSAMPRYALVRSSGVASWLAQLVGSDTPFWCEFTAATKRKACPRRPWGIVAGCEMPALSLR